MTLYRPVVCVIADDVLNDPAVLALVEHCDQTRAGSPDFDAVFKRNGWESRDIVLGNLVRSALDQ